MNARRTGAVSAASLSVMALSLGLAHVIAPEWVKRVGLDVWNYPGLRDQWRATEVEAAQAQAKQDQMHRRMELGSHVSARLATGSITLAEAVDELEPVMRDAPGFESTYLYHYQVPTLRQGVARYAIGKVRDQLADDPARWATVSARLETEYAALR